MSRLQQLTTSTLTCGFLLILFNFINPKLFFFYLILGFDIISGDIVYLKIFYSPDLKGFLKNYLKTWQTQDLDFDLILSLINIITCWCNPTSGGCKKINKLASNNETLDLDLKLLWPVFFRRYYNNCISCHKNPVS